MTTEGGRFKAPVASRVVPELLMELLDIQEGLLPQGPCPERVRLRTLKGKLRAAFPRLFTVNASELAQQLADEDGDACEDTI